MVTDGSAEARMLGGAAKTEKTVKKVGKEKSLVAGF